MGRLGRRQLRGDGWREGDLLALAVGESTADTVVSVFGVIFAHDAAAAIGAVARILRPGAGAFIRAWFRPSRPTPCRRPSDALRLASRRRPSRRASHVVGSR